MISKRLTRDARGQATLTITVVGAHDVYRLARHLLSGQVEFGQLGDRTLRSLRKQLGPGPYDRMVDYFEGRVR